MRRSRLPDIELDELAAGAGVEFEIGVEVAPLIRVEMAVDIEAAILDPVDAREALVPDRMLREVLEAAWVAVIGHRGIAGKQSEPGRPVTRLERLDGRADFRMGQLVQVD